MTPVSDSAMEPVKGRCCFYLHLISVLEQAKREIGTLPNMIGDLSNLPEEYHQDEMAVWSPRQQQNCYSDPEKKDEQN